MKEYLLYITKNNINGKIYAGKHIGYKTDNYIGSGPAYFLKAIKKYGRENFERRWMRLRISTENDLNRLERRLIRLLKYYWGNNCYNIHEGGTGGALCKYYTKVQRQEINRRISNGKKKQYAQGETEHQKRGRQKQSETLRFRNIDDIEFRNQMILKQQKKGKRLSQRIKERGLTEKERQRNKTNTENGHYKLEYEIIYPNGSVHTFTHSPANFIRTHNVEDHIFTAMKKTGQCIIKRRTVNTNHSFPTGTIFKVKKFCT
jgi:hypothetical protein